METDQYLRSVRDARSSIKLVPSMQHYALFIPAPLQARFELIMDKHTNEILYGNIEAEQEEAKPFVGFEERLKRMGICDAR